MITIQELNKILQSWDIPKQVKIKQILDMLNESEEEFGNEEIINGEIIHKILDIAINNPNHQLLDALELIFERQKVDVNTEQGLKLLIAAITAKREDIICDMFKDRLNHEKLGWNLNLLILRARHVAIKINKFDMLAIAMLGKTKDPNFETRKQEFKVKLEALGKQTLLEAIKSEDLEAVNAILRYGVDLKFNGILDLLIQSILEDAKRKVEIIIEKGFDVEQNKKLIIKSLCQQRRKLNEDSYKCLNRNFPDILEEILKIIYIDNYKDLEKQKVMDISKVLQILLSTRREDIFFRMLDNLVPIDKGITIKFIRAALKEKNKDILVELVVRGYNILDYRNEIAEIKLEGYYKEDIEQKKAQIIYELEQFAEDILLSGISKKHSKTVDTLLQDEKFIREHGVRSLYRAMVEEDYEVIRKILKKKIFIENNDKKVHDVFHKLYKKNYFDILDDLIVAMQRESRYLGFDRNQILRNTLGYMDEGEVIRVLVVNGRLDIIDRFIECGINKNQVIREAFLEAILSKKLENVKKVIAHYNLNINADIEPNYYIEGFAMALINESGREILKELIMQGFNFRKNQVSLKIFIQIKKEYQLAHQKDKEHIKQESISFANGCVDLASEIYDEVFNEACMNGDTPRVCNMIKDGYSIKERGYTGLYEAIRNNRIDIVENILNTDFDMNSKGTVEAFKLVLERVLNAMERPTDLYEWDRILKIFIKSGFNFQKALKDETFKSFEKCLNTVNERILNLEISMFEEASLNKDAESVSKIIKNGLMNDAENQSHEYLLGETLFVKALLQRNEKTIIYLIKNGFDANKSLSSETICKLLYKSELNKNICSLLNKYARNVLTIMMHQHKVRINNHFNEEYVNNEAVEPVQKIEFMQLLTNYIDLFEADNSEKSEEMVIVYKIRANEYHKMGNFRQAEEDITKAINIKGHTRYYYLRAKIRFNLEKYDEALQDIEVALETDRFNIEKLKFKQEVLIKLNMWEKVLGFNEIIYALDKDEPKYLKNKLQYYMKLGWAKEALETVKRLITLMPNDPGLYLVKCRIYYDMNFTWSRYIDVFKILCLSLIWQGKHTNIDIDNYLSLLPNAVISGNEELVRKLMDCGVRPEAYDGIGLSAIHIAIKHNKLKILQIILAKYKYILNYKSFTGENAYHFAENIKNETAEFVKQCRDPKFLDEFMSKDMGQISVKDIGLQPDLS